MPTGTPTPTTVAIHGYALREVRIRSGIPIAQLAREVGASRPYLANLELGHKRRVSPDLYSALLRALSISDRRVLLADPYADQVAEGAA